jgi:hypothetical protein
MGVDVCRLCRRTRELQQSHFLPRAVYRRLRNPRADVKDPIWMNAEIALLTSRQTKDYLLCGECEDLFNRNGERYVAQQMCNKTRFPLLERLHVSPVFDFSLNEGVYSGPAVGVDTDKLAYFAVSVIWRGAAHDWPSPSGCRHKRIDLRGFEEPLRKYLLGEGGLPSEATVIVTVARDHKSQCTAYEPSEADGPSRGAYGFLVCGIHFYVFLGAAIPTQMRESSCVNSRRQLIFLQDIERHTDMAMGKLARTARLVGRLSELNCVPPSETFNASGEHG